MLLDRLGRSKNVVGLACRLLDRRGLSRIAAVLVCKIWTWHSSAKKNKKEEGPARASPVAAPMPKSVSF